MTIKIVLPEGDGVKTGWGTKVFTESGEEIKGITKISISPIELNSIIEATLTVEVSNIENLEGVQCLVEDMPSDFIERQLEKHGYKLVKINGLDNEPS